MKKCPMCKGPRMFLGQLGLMRWFRCRNCGMDFSKRTKEKN